MPQAGAPGALALVRIPRGAPRPSDDVFAEAVQKDRALLQLPEAHRINELEVAGPYEVTIDGDALDEYVVWEK